MAIRFYQQIGFLKDSRFLQNYEKYLEYVGLKIDPLLWIIIAIVVAAVASFVTYLLLVLFQANIAIVLVFVMYVVVLDLLMGYPYNRGMTRISEIEKNLPDALKQMADILKAGGTYEFALRELSQSDFGPLTKEIKNVLVKLEEGESFENSLMSLHRNVDSRVTRRSITIIIDSIRAGAGLADILDKIADDVRDTNRITQERKTRTLMQVMFMVAAGAVVSPFIFGLVSTIGGFLIASASGLGVISEAVRQQAINDKNFILILLQLYIFIQVVATSLMLALMREGNKNKSIIYLPVLLFIAYLVYFIAIVVSTMMLGGMNPAAVGIGG